MATQTIHGYAAASAIDPIADYLLIDPASTGNYNKINRNVLLGITGSPLGTTDTQNVSAKTLNNTNTITTKDSLLTLQNASDTTKQGVFSLASVTTGTTRTYTLPNASVTLASLTGTETLTNKTITGATISGGSIDNATITVDSISGHTIGTTVTVGGVQLANGIVATTGAVNTNSIVAGAVVPNSLQASTGSGWSWQTYSPTLANITIGNGTVVARYNQIGKTLFARISITLGSTSAMGSGPTISLPVTARSGYLAGAESYGSVQILHTGNYVNPGVTVVSDANNVVAYCVLASGTYAQWQAITSAIPFTWGTGDALYFYLVYEAA